MEHNEILKIIEDYHNNTSDNIIGVGYGYKSVNGLYTGEKAIIFTVKEKLPINKLSSNDILPSKIELNYDNYIVTDVVQGSFQLSCDSEFYSWMSTPPTNRNKIRPLKGGISLTNYTSLPQSVGTLGFLAIDNDTNSLVGVTNNHVIINDAFLASDRSSSGILTNVRGNITTQPNEQYVNGLSHSIGVVKKYYPIKTGQYNYIDVALTTINESEISLSESYKQEGLTTTTLPFATTGELNDLLTTNPFLYSAGRTTGAKGEGNTKLLVISSPAVISAIYYNRQGVSTPVSYSDCIQFVASGSTVPQGSVCTYPINGGDSGSALIADFGGTKKIIGLVFASGSNGSDVIFGYACRIDRIASMMNISAWNGESVSYSNTYNIEEYKVNGLSSDVYIDSGGKRYWQIGVKNK